MSNKKFIPYKSFTKDELKEVIDEVFKDYKDPTEGMTLEERILFDKEMKKQAKIYFNDEWNRDSDI